ncbi:MAG: hypothetical protein H6742_12880 [Alphaproteobacteria bacterium]|nr:hypothetical protein [Alphaproteobacteria bacterium]
MPRRPIHRNTPPTPASPGPDSGGTTQLSLRLPTSLVARAEALVEAMRVSPPPGVTRVTRTLVLRLALERGLSALEADHGLMDPEGGSAPGRSR